MELNKEQIELIVERFKKILPNQPTIDEALISMAVNDIVEEPYIVESAENVWQQLCGEKLKNLLKETYGFDDWKIDAIIRIYDDEYQIGSPVDKLMAFLNDENCDISNDIVNLIRDSIEWPTVECMDYICLPLQDENGNFLGIQIDYYDDEYQETNDDYRFTKIVFTKEQLQEIQDICESRENKLKFIAIEMGKIEKDAIEKDLEALKYGNISINQCGNMEERMENAKSLMKGNITDEMRNWSSEQIEVAFDKYSAKMQEQEVRF